MTDNPFAEFYQLIKPDIEKIRQAAYEAGYLKGIQDAQVIVTRKENESDDR